MSNQFPPSSPVASTSYTHPSKFNNSIASDETTMQHDSNASSPFMEKKLQHLKGARRAPNETQYPSPFPSSSTGTVSYTHLDVYKRQVLRQTLPHLLNPQCLLCQQNL